MFDNFVEVVGNVTRDPELRFAQSGMAICQVGIAWNRRRKDQDDEVSFFDVTCFRELAENVAETVKKGMRVVVTGQLQQRSWTTDDGGKRSKVEILANDVAPSLRWASADVKRNDRPDAAGGGRVWADDLEASSGGGGGAARAGGGADRGAVLVEVTLHRDSRVSIDGIHCGKWRRRWGGYGQRKVDGYYANLLWDECRCRPEWFCKCRFRSTSTVVRWVELTPEIVRVYTEMLAERAARVAVYADFSEDVADKTIERVFCDSCERMVPKGHAHTCYDAKAQRERNAAAERKS